MFATERKTRFPVRETSFRIINVSRKEIGRVFKSSDLYYQPVFTSISTDRTINYNV